MRFQLLRLWSRLSSLRLSDTAPGRIVQRVGFQHRDRHRQKPVCDTAQSTPMRVPFCAQLRLVLLALPVALRAHPGPMI